LLLERQDGGRVCEDAEVESRGSEVLFNYLGWGGPWSFALVMRPYVLRYRYVNGGFEEHFGFAGRPDDFGEDWLMRAWSLAQEATVASERARLEPIHSRLHDALVRRASSSGSPEHAEYTRELFPVSESERRLVLYCAMSESRAPCHDWPIAIELQLVKGDGSWLVRDARPSRPRGRRLGSDVAPRQPAADVDQRNERRHGEPELELELGTGGGHGLSGELGGLGLKGAGKAWKTSGPSEPPARR
jgi:hypothetical protein